MLRRFQGEARWDDPAAFQGANNHALVERGYQEALAGVSNGVTGAQADQSAVAEYYGEQQRVQRRRSSSVRVKPV